MTGETDERDDWTLRYGEIQETRIVDGVQQGLRSYFRNTAQVARLGSPVVIRFEEAPTVKFGGMVTSTDVARLTTVLQIINSALPNDWKLKMATGVPEPLPEDLAGSIYVEFLPERAYQRAVDYSSLGSATVSHSTVEAEISHAHVQINRTYAGNGETEAAIVLAHELIQLSRDWSCQAGHEQHDDVYTPHFRGRPSNADPVPGRSEGLACLVLGHGAGGSCVGLGAVERHRHASRRQRLPDVAFGVAYADGHGEPWAYGIRPEMVLADNPDLLGTARWSGLLLGFTSDDYPLSGKSALAIQLDDMTGTARFTQLETWDKGSLPGRAGQGTDWNTGRLSYDVLVTDNTFRQTGGDEGTVTGSFFGDSHEAMGGVLERTDLTAAFGGAR